MPSEEYWSGSLIASLCLTPEGDFIGDSLSVDKRLICALCFTFQMAGANREKAENHAFC
jgi:hypothetical protein